MAFLSVSPNMDVRRVHLTTAIRYYLCHHHVPICFIKSVAEYPMHFSIKSPQNILVLMKHTKQCGILVNSTILTWWSVVHPVKVTRWCFTNPNRWCKFNQPGTASDWPGIQLGFIVILQGPAHSWSLPTCPQFWLLPALPTSLLLSPPHTSFKVNQCNAALPMVCANAGQLHALHTNASQLHAPAFSRLWEE